MTDKKDDKVTEENFLKLANEIGEYIFNKTRDSSYSLEILHHLTLVEIVILAEETKKEPKVLMNQFANALCYNLKDYCATSIPVDENESSSDDIVINPNSKYDKSLN